MADVSFNRQPQNPNAFDMHAYYRRDDPIYHGHLQMNQNGTVFNRPPGTNLLGEIAITGGWEPWHR